MTSTTIPLSCIPSRRILGYGVAQFGPNPPGDGIGGIKMKFGVLSLRVVLGACGLVGLGPQALNPFAAELGKPSVTNQTRQAMSTNVVEAAMKHIREREFNRAFELLRPASNAGDAGAQALLGQMFQAGWGVSPDFNQAFKWWSRAAEQGNTDAQWGLGLLYNDGKGVRQDDKKAADWWIKAAEKGNIKATVNLAFLYEEGRGVSIDQKESAKLFKRAAEAREPFAQMKYGLKLLAGEGVEQDNALGAAWIAVAAESVRIEKSARAERFQSKREKVWGSLSPEERNLAEKRRNELIMRLQSN